MVEYGVDGLDRYRQITYRVTVHYLSKHVEPPPAHFLDVGCGTGRYALDLARCGYEVSLVDPSPSQLIEASDRIARAGLSRKVRQTLRADPTDLHHLPDAMYDAVLLLDALRRMPFEDDRTMAVAEAYRVLKPGGVIAAAFAGRYAPIRAVLNTAPTDTVGLRPAHSADHYLAQAAEIPPFMAELGFATLDMVACESFAAGMQPTANSISDSAMFERWLTMLTDCATDPELLGAADTLLYVGKKPEGGFSRVRGSLA